MDQIEMDYMDLLKQAENIELFEARLRNMQRYQRFEKEKPGWRQQPGSKKGV